jgi:salicylate 5-hydroxylase small subunit
MSADRLERIELRLEVEELYAAYCACLDVPRYEQWPDFFTDDCVYRLVPRENHEAGLPLATLSFESKAMLKDRVYGITHTLFHAPYYQRHIVSGIQVLESGEHGMRIESNYLVLRTKRNELPELFNIGRYLDRVVRTGQGLRFAEKHCIFDSELIPNSIIYPI